jgi:hypothetical protein
MSVASSWGNSHLGENQLIKTRRANENALASAQSRVSEQQWMKQRVEWEARTDQKVQTTLVHNLAKGLQRQEELSLIERRARLKVLLDNEAAEYHKEILGLRGTTAQRAARQLEKARQLREAREAERQAYAQECYDRQWRDSCDDLRTINSEHFTAFCAEAVADQKREKARLDAEAAQKNAKWSAYLKLEQDKMNAREDAEADRRQKLSDDNRDALLAQMHQVEYARTNARENARLQRDNLKTEMRRDAADADRRGKALKAQKRADMEELVAYNTLSMQARDARRQHEKDLDNAWLSNEIAKFEEETSHHNNKKDTMQREMREFREYTRARKEADDAQERELDRLIEVELDKQQSKRDAVHQAEARARSKLMSEVHTTRQQQMDEKNEARRKHREDILRERDNVSQSIFDERVLQDEEDAAERAAALQMRQDLEKQMRMKEMKKNVDRARGKMEREFSEQAEAQYNGFLSGQKSKQSEYIPPARGLNTRFTKGVGSHR